MTQIVSSIVGTFYTHCVKRILFRLSPDSVHRNMIRAIRASQRIGPMNWLVSAALTYRNEAMLGQTLHGVRFTNPVGLSAGFDKNIELAPTINALGFGFMTGGSVTYYPCEGNPRPWFYRVPRYRSLVVHVGLANQGALRVCQRIRGYRSNLFANFPLVVSVAKTNNRQNCNDQDAIADYVGSLKLLSEERSVRVIEVNISCPNTYGGEPFTTPKRLDLLLRSIDQLSVTQPVWIKMPINLPWAEFDALLQVITKHKISTVTIGNLTKNRADIPVADLPKKIAGNLSGGPTKDLSNDLIRQTYAAYGDTLTIVGVGGIFTAEDAYEKICLGASLVALVTGMVYMGPQLVGQINRGLAALLEKDHLTNIGEAVGSRNNLIL